MTMKNITFVIGIMGNGGAERVISILSEELIKRGKNINIITIYGSRIDYEINKKIKVFDIECKNSKKILRYFERIIKLRKIIKDIDSDIIISFLADVNIFTLIATMFSNHKIIVSERNDPNSDPNNNFIRKLRNRMYLFSDGYVFQTDDARSYFSKKIKESGIVISNPVKSDLPNKFNGKRKKEIVSVCRLSQQKNIKMSIDAFDIFSKRFQDYKYIIYGDGPLRAELLKYIEELGLSKKINLAGFEKNIHEKIHDSKMLIISSDYEGISNTMLESMAIGLPVISTDCPIGGAKMAIENNQNGILVPVGNVKALADAMIRLNSDDRQLEKISNNSLKVKEKFSTDSICKKWIEYIEEVIGDDYDK